MVVDGFGKYLKAEIETIDEFRKAESGRLGRELTANEAAELWISSGRAAKFRKEYEARLKNDEREVR